MLSAQSSNLHETPLGHMQEAEERVFASVATAQSGAGTADGEDEEDDAHTKLLRSASPLGPIFLGKKPLLGVEAWAAFALHGTKQSI